MSHPPPVIAIVDRWFHPHPDLTATSPRIRALVDATRGAPARLTPHGQLERAERGTAMACLAGGDGWSSDGLGRGAAPDAHLVLASVGTEDDDPTDATLDVARLASGLGVATRYPHLGVRVVACAAGPRRCDADDPSLATVVGALAQRQVPLVVPHDASFGPDAAVIRAHVGGPSRGGHAIGVPEALLVAPLLPSSAAARESHHLFGVLAVLEEARVREDFALDRGSTGDATFAPSAPPATQGSEGDAFHRAVTARIAALDLVTPGRRRAPWAWAAAAYAAGELAALLAERRDPQPAISSLVEEAQRRIDARASRARRDHGDAARP